ncbi:MAG: DUF2232 domain-containing protein [Intestinibaculum porci]|uniref:DUF2232 domain-containing protein n=1 Tax=Intestinibaculum porci TaxID=2487118 RepID=UPI000EC536B2|nr:hypothetical protein [Erysipelotrichaceae bacterium]
MKTRKLVYGAMIAALVGVISLLNSYTAGTFDTLIGYFMVIPFAWYGYTYSLKDNLLVAFASIIIVLFTGLPTFLIIACYAAAFGTFVGECLHRQASKATMLLGGLIISFVVNLLEVTILAKIVDINMTRDMTSAYNSIINYMPQMKKTISLSQFLNLIPMMILLLSVMECYVMLGITQIVMLRLKVPFPANFHIATFNMGKPFAIMAAIVFGISMFYLQKYQLKNQVANYLYYGSFLLFAVQGMSFLAFMMLCYNHPKMPALLFILFFIPMVAQFYALIGAFDVFTGARQRLYNNITKGG